MGLLERLSDEDSGVRSSGNSLFLCKLRTPQREPETKRSEWKSKRIESRGEEDEGKRGLEEEEE